MAIKLITGPLGPLTVRVVDDDARSGPPALVVVLCHGYGAPGTDLVSLARECFAVEPTLVGRVRFVFPEAPHTTDFGGRCWWPIDMAALQKAMATAHGGRVIREMPAGLPDARKGLKQMVEALQTSTKLPMSKVLLGGFSQGAMLTTDLTLRLDEAPAGLAILSGTPVGEEEWAKLAVKRAGLQVLQSHGTHDPVLPYAGAEALRDLLTHAGLKVNFMKFNGGHGLDSDVLEALAHFIAEKAAA